MKNLALRTIITTSVLVLISACATRSACAADLLTTTAEVVPTTLCIKQATDKYGAYGVSAPLLNAIILVESGGNPYALGRNAQSADIGLMQINTGWIQTLQQQGIPAETLWHACQNIFVGAWILANNFQQHGFNWQAVGAYNVGCKHLDQRTCATRRNAYIAKIKRALMKQQFLTRLSISTPMKRAES